MNYHYINTGVTNRNMFKACIHIILFVLIILLSCDKQPLITPCKNCTESEPVTALLEAKINEYSKTTSIAVINLYEGNIEDSILLGRYSFPSEKWSRTVSVNKKYTVTATYLFYGSEYTAIDSATPRVKYETEQCEKPCYYVYDTNLDLRIKYLK
jgi:hypothetical protein